MMSKSYISKQSLIDACNAYSESPWANDYGAYSKGVRDALRTIKDCAQVKSEDATIGIGLPNADVVEVVHGCWMDHVNPRNDDDWACSNCGSYFVFEAGDPIANGTNYCPNCGAKMDGGADNG